MAGVFSKIASFNGSVITGLEDHTRNPEHHPVAANSISVISSTGYLIKPKSC
jgi:hypothetical protein